MSAEAVMPKRGSRAAAARVWLVQYLPLAAATVVAVGLLAHYLRSGWFFLDDFRNLGQARAEGLTWHFLTSPVYQHFAPGHHFLDWLVIDVFGYRHDAAVGLLLVFVAVAMAAMNALLDELLGRRLLHTGLAFMYGLSAPVLLTSFWFAGAAHAIPASCFIVVAMWAFARWSNRGGRPLDLAITVLATAAALAFWVQAVLIPLLCALCAICVLPEGLTPRGVARNIRRHITPLALQSALVVAYLVYLSTRSYAPRTSTPGLSETLHFLKVMLNHATFPFVVGNGLPNTGVSQWGRTTQVLGALVIAATFVWSLVTRRAVWRAVLFFAAGFLGTAATIWAGRLALNGPLIGNEPRYLVPVMITIVVSAALAASRVGRPADADLRRPRVGVAAGVGAVALSAYAGIFIHMARGNWFGRNEGEQARAFFARLAPGLDSARARGLRDSFVDVELGNPIWYASRQADDQLSTLREAIAPDIRTLGAREPLQVIQPDGTVAQERFRAMRGTAGTRASCGGRQPCELRAAVRQTPQAAAAEYVRVSGLQASGTSDLTVTPTASSFAKDDPATVVDVPAGVTSVVVPAWSSQIKSVTVRLRGTTSARPTVAVGSLAPVGSG